MNHFQQPDGGNLGEVARGGTGVPQARPSPTLGRFVAGRPTSSVKLQVAAGRLRPSLDLGVSINLNPGGINPRPH